jgi:hypothetical protein
MNEETPDPALNGEEIVAPCPNDLLSGDFPCQITIGDKYGPAMEMTEQSDADAYWEKCVRHSMSFGTSREEAESIERQNLGYYAGYYSHEARARVERLFRCAHPVFGGIAQNGPPTTREALTAGLERGRAVSR